MKIIDTKIKEVKIIQLDIYPDERGFFVERFNTEKFAKLGLPLDFVQDNHSRSNPRVLRGLHYQIEPFQEKLVGCLKGKIQDVAVDIRKDSPTYLQYVSIELSGDNGKLLWIPQGFAHGFCVLGEEEADVFYKVDNLYNPAGDKGIIWNDPKINIDWQVKDPILSEKDAELPLLI